MSKQYDTIDFTRKFAQITPGFSEDLTTNSIIKTFLEEMKGYMGKDYLLLMPYFSSDYRDGKIKFEFDDEYQFLINEDSLDNIMQEMANHYSYKTGISEYFCNNFSKSAAVEMRCDEMGNIIVELINYEHGDLSSCVDGIQNKFIFKKLWDIEKIQAYENDVRVVTSDQDIKDIVDKIKKGFVAHKPFLHDNQRVYFISEPNIMIKGAPRSTGGLFLVRDGEMTNQELSFFIISEFLLASKIEIINDIINAHKNAVRAAIAQVMARNMSHNFGSHVLSNLISNDAYSMLTDRNILKAKAYVSPWETKMKYPKEQVQIVKSHSGNFQLSYFNQYLKSRMDYLSEVTFGVSNLLTTKMMYGEVMKELDQVRILLNYISGVSNFKYTFKLMVVDEKGEEKEMTADNDIGVAFPSDVLGCHAFYNIIENIIRNTAKHAKNTGDVTFTIKFKDVADVVCKHIEEAAELYCVEIDNGVFEDGIDELVNKQNDRLNQSVLENNNLRSNSLGLLEMEASAAFLRQIDLPEIESEDYTIDYGTPEELSRYYHERNGKKRLNILKAFAIDKQQDNTGRLGYRFFVQKPKEFLFVGNWDDVGKAKKKEMLNIGIQFISANQFMTDLEKEKAFAHQFMVYDSSLCEAVAEKLKKARIISNKYNNDNNDKLKEIKEQLHSYSTLLPLRKLKISEDEKKTISSYWSSNKQVNSSKGKTNKVGNAHDKAILQKLKERAWERYYKNELLKEEMEPLPNIFIRSSFDSSCSNQVVFLDHANEEGHLKECKHISKGKEVYIENLTSQTRVKLPVFTELSKGRKEKLINNYVNNIRALYNDDSDLSGKKRMIREEIFEAYHNKVIILDERVQQFAEKNSEGEEPKIPCWKLFSSTNVHIPRRPKYDNNGNPIPLKDLYGNELDVDDFRVFSLDPNDFGEIKEKVKAFVDYYSKEYNSKSKPFILVHYGILERMCGGDVKEINELLKQWVKMAKRVVVTSGRGAHSLDLPKSVCFVNLSSVLYVCNENRNKYLINYLLNQSRRKRNE